jgi:endonuclease YncB( thermonuclease family)
MRIWIGLILICASELLLAATSYGNVTASRVGTVIDGDSFKVDIGGWPDIAGKSITVRINGIDTPEMRGKCRYEKSLAREAKQFAVGKLRAAKIVELRSIKRGKYFRIVADVYLDGRSLGLQLLKAGLAREYNKKRRSWCE